MIETPRVCIDRVLPRDQMRFQRTEAHGNRTRAIIPIGKLWMNGSALHVRFLGGTAAQRATARAQALWWTQHANLTFVFDDSPTAEIRVAFDPADGAWSYLGSDNRSIPVDQPTMNLGFLDGGTAGHEFGHAIGLAHEHQNPAGGIQWNEARVLQDLSGPPNNWTPDQIRHNVLHKYAVDQIQGTAFDPKSIMLYFFPASWTLNGIGTAANDVLSDVDKSYVGGPTAYPKPAGPPSAVARTITVNSRRRTSAVIGKPGEEDLFRFQVTTGGRHVVDTRGSTDLVMKLFGPDSETDLIATDDDSGVDLNPSITASLVPGSYLVQVRHYRADVGTGRYTVKVRTA